LRYKYTATAVVPEWRASKSCVRSISACACRNAASSATAGFVWRSSWPKSDFAIWSHANCDTHFPFSPCPSKTPRRTFEPLELDEAT